MCQFPYDLAGGWGEVRLSSVQESGRESQLDIYYIVKFPTNQTLLLRDHVF